MQFEGGCWVVDRIANRILKAFIIGLFVKLDAKSGAKRDNVGFAVIVEIPDLEITDRVVDDEAHLAKRFVKGREFSFA